MFSIAHVGEASRRNGKRLLNIFHFITICFLCSRRKKRNREWQSEEMGRRCSWSWSHWQTTGWRRKSRKHVCFELHFSVIASELHSQCAYSYKLRWGCTSVMSSNVSLKSSKTASIKIVQALFSSNHFTSLTKSPHHRKHREKRTGMTKTQAKKANDAMNDLYVLFSRPSKANFLPFSRH